MIRKFVIFVITAVLYCQGIGTTFAQVSFSQEYGNQKVVDELQKGNRIIGLNLMVNGGKHTFFSAVTGQAGYFLAKNLVGGVQLSVGKKSLDLKDAIGFGDLEQTSTFSLAPEIYARYYISNFKVKPIAQLSMGYNHLWNKESYANAVNTVSSTGTFTASGMLGFGFLVGRRLSIEALYNMPLNKRSQNVDNPFEGVKFRIGAALFLR